MPRCTGCLPPCAKWPLPVASGILIICLVFLPLLTLQGLEGKLFAPVALTIVFALAGSLLLSLTVIPVLASLPAQARRARRTLADAPGGARLPRRCWSALAHPRHAAMARQGQPAAGRGRLPGHRQDLHADHGRGRHPGAAGEAAVDQPRAPRWRPTCACSARSSRGCPRCATHRRARRLRRARLRPDGPEPDRHVPAAEAPAEWRVADKDG
jgi:hypothetical protein